VNCIHQSSLDNATQLNVVHRRHISLLGLLNTNVYYQLYHTSPRTIGILIIQRAWRTGLTEKSQLLTIAYRPLRHHVPLFFDWRLPYAPFPCMECRRTLKQKK
jgi:hypothetical protein